jgi:hypothetical protein
MYVFMVTGLNAHYITGTLRTSPFSCSNDSEDNWESWELLTRYCKGTWNFVDDSCLLRDASDDRIARLSTVIRGVCPASTFQCQMGKWLPCPESGKLGCYTVA